MEAKNNECIVCDRIFKNKIGLNIHKSRIHCKEDDKKLPQYLKIITKSKNEYCIKNMDEMFIYCPVDELEKMSFETESDSEEKLIEERKKKIKKKRKIKKPFLN